MSPSSEYSGLISFRFDWFDLPAVQGALKSLLQVHRGVLSRFPKTYTEYDTKPAFKNKVFLDPLFMLQPLCGSVSKLISLEKETESHENSVLKGHTLKLVTKLALK